ncbi:hypothetical protein ES703_81565 [subsurface metagenome]
MTDYQIRQGRVYCNNCHQHITVDMAERAALGGIIEMADVYPPWGEHGEKLIRSQKHKAIFQAMMRLQRYDGELYLLALLEELDRGGELEHVGGIHYLCNLAWPAPQADDLYFGVLNLYWLRTMPYAEYLNTAHWQSVRAEALRRAAGRCQLCNAQSDLHVHHRTYDRRGYEWPADLTVLCADCHAKFHDKLPVPAAEEVMAFNVGG